MKGSIERQTRTTYNKVESMLSETENLVACFYLLSKCNSCLQFSVFTFFTRHMFGVIECMRMCVPQKK